MASTDNPARWQPILISHTGHRQGWVMCKRQIGCIKRLQLAGVALVILGSASPARAALGGDASTIQADQLSMRGTRRTIAGEAYTVHEIQGTSGTVVREYLSPEGIVFAVAWRGPWMPDMRQILGSYFEPYAQGVQARRDDGLRRGPVLIEQPGLVVQSSGHPRWFTGKAYVPAMVPKGLRAEDIQ